MFMYWNSICQACEQDLVFCIHRNLFISHVYNKNKLSKFWYMLRSFNLVFLFDPHIKWPLYECSGLNCMIIGKENLKADKLIGQVGYNNLIKVSCICWYNFQNHILPSNWCNTKFHLGLSLNIPPCAWFIIIWDRKHCCYWMSWYFFASLCLH